MAHRTDEQQLEAFQRWMVKRGRSEGTAEQYFWCVRQCLNHPKGPLARLVGRKLAPKTKRINKAALRAWARFTGDKDLLLELEDIRLPPPERVTVKEPMSTDEWAALLDAIENANIDEILRAALTMICERGFRVSDVLRLSPFQIQRALDTGVLVYQGKGQRKIECLVEPFAHSLTVFMNEGRYGEWDHVWDLVSPSASSPQRAARLRMQRCIKRVAKAAGINEDDIYTHRPRRTVASEFYDETKDIVALQNYMGWADIKTASNYVDHSRRDELERIAAGIRKRRDKKR